MYSPQQTAFAPRSLISTLAVTSVAQAGVQVVWLGNAGASSAADYRFYNDGNTPILLGYGATAQEAMANAGSSGTATANGRKAVPIAPSGIEILKFGEQTFFAATTNGNCNLHIVGGQGI